MIKTNRKEYWQHYRTLRASYDAARIRYDNMLQKFPANHPICLMLQRSRDNAKDYLDNFVTMAKVK